MMQECASDERTRTMILRTMAAILAGLGLLPGHSFAQEQEVDLELVLAVDVSRSMEPVEQEL